MIEETSALSVVPRLQIDPSSRNLAVETVAVWRQLKKSYVTKLDNFCGTLLRATACKAKEDIYLQNVK